MSKPVVMIWTQFKVGAVVEDELRPEIKPRCVFKGYLPYVPRIGEYVGGFSDGDVGQELVSSVSYNIFNNYIEISVDAVHPEEYEEVDYTAEVEETEL